MIHNEHNVEILLAAARKDRQALGKLLEHYRAFLVLMAEQHVSSKVSARCDVLDVIQQTFADVVRRFDDFAGTTEPQFSAWILQIHLNNIRQVTRTHVTAQKRSVDREEPDSGEDGSASLFWHDFPSDGSTPSKRLIRGEQALRLASVLETLPERQCRALRMRFFQGMSVKAIAEGLDTTGAAVGGLLKHGLRNLRQRMNQDSWS
jgi:RNA polymerase sigma-70 factor (ECF subfamily)